MESTSPNFHSELLKALNLAKGRRWPRWRIIWNYTPLTVAVKDACVDDIKHFPVPPKPTPPPRPPHSLSRSPPPSMPSQPFYEQQWRFWVKLFTEIYVFRVFTETQVSYTS